MVCEFCVLFAQESSLMLEEYASELLSILLFAVFYFVFTGWMNRLSDELKANTEAQTRAIVNELRQLKKESGTVHQDINGLWQGIQRIHNSEHRLLEAQKTCLQDIRNSTSKISEEMYQLKVGILKVAANTRKDFTEY